MGTHQQQLHRSSHNFPQTEQVSSNSRWRIQPIPFCICLQRYFSLSMTNCLVAVQSCTLSFSCSQWLWNGFHKQWVERSPTRAWHRYKSFHTVPSHWQLPVWACNQTVRKTISLTLKGLGPSILPDVPHSASFLVCTLYRRCTATNAAPHESFAASFHSMRTWLSVTTMLFSFGLICTTCWCGAALKGLWCAFRVMIAVIA